MNVPVLHHDRMPEGAELELFTGQPADEWNEHWVGLDVPTARRISNDLLDAFNAMRGPALIDWIPHRALDSDSSERSRLEQDNESPANAGGV